MKIFLGGSKGIHTLPAKFMQRLLELMQQESCFLVGDCRGADDILHKSNEISNDVTYVTMYIAPIIYHDSEISSTVYVDEKGRYHTDVNPDRIIDGPLSEYRQELENPVAEEFNKFKEDCVFIIKELGFTVIKQENRTTSKKSEYVIVYGIDDTPCGTLIYNIRISDHVVKEMTFREEDKDHVLEYLKMNNILDGDAEKAGIDFSIDGIIVGGVRHDTWDRAFNRLYILMKRLRNKNSMSTETKRINVSVVVGYADQDNKVAATTYEKVAKSFNIPDGSLLPADKEIYIDTNSQLVADYDAFIESVEDLITDYYNLKIYYKNSSIAYSKYFGMLVKDDNGNVIIDFDFTLRISNHIAHRTPESQKHKKERKAKLAEETNGKKTKPIVKSILVNDKEFSSYLDAYEYVDKLIGEEDHDVLQNSLKDDYFET